LINVLTKRKKKGRHGCMVVGLTINYGIGAYYD